MDVDLSEYDQIDEIKLLQDNHEKIFGSATKPSSLLETLSSNSGGTDTTQNAYDEANCENDFVFLPAPPQPTTAAISAPNAQPQQLKTPTQLPQSQLSHHQQQQQQQPPRSQPTVVITAPYATQVLRTNPMSEPARQTTCHPLVAINNNTKNPFCQPVSTPGQEIIGLRPIKHQVPNVAAPVTTTSARPVVSAATSIASGRIVESFVYNKPVGILEMSLSSMSANPDKTSYLLQQIVARADTIDIVIPCHFCHEPIVCPPKDISAWLNHMSTFHNCKTCPICDKLIGLGPRKDVGIMRKHVISHSDNEWLERRAQQACVTFGLQQQWFSSSRCSVKETRNR